MTSLNAQPQPFPRSIHGTGKHQPLCLCHGQLGQPVFQVASRHGMILFCSTPLIHLLACLFRPRHVFPPDLCCDREHEASGGGRGRTTQLMPRTRRERFLLSRSLLPSRSRALSLSLSTRRAACAVTGDVVVFGIGREMFQSALVAPSGWARVMVRRISRLCILQLLKIGRQQSAMLASTTVRHSRHVDLKVAH